MKWRTLLALLALCLASHVTAHPAPFSYLDVDVQPDGIEGTVRVHMIDIAHELALPDATVLLHQHGNARQEEAIKRLIDERLHIIGEGRLAPVWGDIRALPAEEALEIPFRVNSGPLASVEIEAALFPYDPAHQTFVNVSESGQLRQQWILSGEGDIRTHFTGSAAGLLATLGTFIPAGIEHIAIGPDHILFVIGLILLGGNFRQLAMIVTAFTIGHSITLSLAALDIVSIHPAIVEPLIALSIVIVGLDNLLRREGRDVRAYLAGFFGLIHGFGFASVLRELGLPQGNRATALFGFNLGVEIGQLVIVLAVGTFLTLIRKRAPLAGRRIATIGSVAVIAAGAYWFVTRLIAAGGGA